MNTPSRLVCRLCGGHVLEVKCFLSRVNPEGEVPAIWECRPYCTVDMSPDDALLAAIDATMNPKAKGGAQP